MLQDDIFLNGVPYVQSINDVTNPAPPTGIHFEPGIWLIAPATTNPQEPISLARMASIPHGVTIVAQGVALPAKAGPPGIHSVDITPTPVGGGAPIKFPSQTAANQNTARIPQDLTPWMNAGTITQALLDDPNLLLKNAIAVQNILSTTTILVSTNPASPLFGGGTDNIAFLLGNAAGRPRTRTPSRCPRCSGSKLSSTNFTSTFRTEVLRRRSSPAERLLDFQYRRSSLIRPSN